MAIASSNEFPSLLLKEGSAPSSPASGDQRLWVGADHILHMKNSSGVVTDVGMVVSLISPTQLVANTDNYVPTGGSTAKLWRLSTDASRNITGISISQVDGRVVYIQNVGAFNIVLKHDVTSTAANRFLLPGATDMTLVPNDGVIIYYDASDLRWRTLART